MSEFIIENYEDFFVTSGNNKSLLESYKTIQKKIEKLAPKYRNDDSVRLNLLKETHSRKTSNTLYRKNVSAKDTLVTLWLSKVKNLAYLYCSLNVIPEFNGISKAELLEISSLNSDVDNLNCIEEVLAKKGIVLVIDHSIVGLNTDGAVCKLDSGTPVIALSLRYGRFDIFWFTLMHELSHIHLHYNLFEDLMVDNFDLKSDELIELQANKLAGDLLIPRSIWRSCLARKDLKDKSVMSFAQKHSIHPAIVAGRINKERNEHNTFAKIINEINVRDVFINE